MYSMLTTLDRSSSISILDQHAIVWRDQSSAVRQVADLITITSDVILEIDNSAAEKEASSSSDGMGTTMESSVGSISAGTFGLIATAIRHVFGADAGAYYYYWPGYGGLQLGYPLGRVLQGPLTTTVPNTGPIVQSPSLCWDPGGGWMLASHCDSPSSYVGAPVDLVNDIRQLLPDTSARVLGGDLVDDWLRRP